MLNYYRPIFTAVLLFFIGFEKASADSNNLFLTSVVAEHYRYPVSSTPQTKVSKSREPVVFAGVLEDIAGDDKSLMMTSGPHVRVVFRKESGAWIPMETDWENFKTGNDRCPKSIHWTAFLNDKVLGKLQSKKPDLYKQYPDIGVQLIDNPLPPELRVSEGVSNFYYLPGKCGLRPLLLTSAPDVHDPEDWKPTTLTGPERALAVQTFRKKFPKEEYCGSIWDGHPKMISYPDSQIHFDAYRSGQNEVFLGMSYDFGHHECGFYEDENYYSYWYVLKNTKVLRFIGTEFQPVGAADLDGDGKSEWLIHVSLGENDDHYILMSDGFSKAVTFGWSYH